MDEPRRNQEMNPVNNDNERLSPVSGRTSPVRPENPDPPRPRITPSLARPTRPDIPRLVLPEVPEEPKIPENLTPEEKSRRALEGLDAKIENVLKEYSEGKINQAQFNAIYRRYSEQREIMQKLLQRNPATGAWQSVVQPGHTGFLREHFSSKILSYALYRLDNGEQIVLQGSLRLPREQLLPIFQKLNALIKEGKMPQLAARKLKDESWVVLVPGKNTISVVIYSLEPAAAQRQRLEEIQRDFERANERLIAQRDFDADMLVFPHRTLFE